MSIEKNDFFFVFLYFLYSVDNPVKRFGWTRCHFSDIECLAQRVRRLEPYTGLPVKKEECVEHVEKRMGTWIINVKKEHKDISGKGQ